VRHIISLWIFFISTSAFAADTYTKVGENTLEITKTVEQKQKFTINELEFRKNNLEASLAEVNALISKAQEIGIESNIEG